VVASRRRSVVVPGLIPKPPGARRCTRSVERRLGRCRGARVLSLPGGAPTRRRRRRHRRRRVRRAGGAEAVRAIRLQHHLGRLPRCEANGVRLAKRRLRGACRRRACRQRRRHRGAAWRAGGTQPASASMARACPCQGCGPSKSVRVHAFILGIGQDVRSLPHALATAFQGTAVCVEISAPRPLPLFRAQPFFMPNG
jgi:hypothetical protein